MPNRNRAATDNVLATFGLLDAEHPPALAEVLARHATIAATQANIDDAPDLTLAAIAAYAAGRDPAEDPAVNVAITRRHLADVALPIETHLVGELGDAIRTDTPGIIESWRPRFDDLAATLTACHQKLSGEDLSDTRAVLALRGDAARTWGIAKDTLGAFRRVSDGWSSLAMLGGLTVDRRFALLWCSSIDLSSGDIDADLSARDPWRALDQGLTLNLATPTEAVAARAAIDAARSARWDRTVAADKARRHPPILVD